MSQIDYSGPSRSSGFTLVELLVTIAVMMVALASMPSMMNMVKNGRQLTAANDMLFALVSARDEAVLRNHPVSVCQSDDGTDCTDEG